ncbi:glutathione peroxidase [Corticibacter populi]|uniref:Glutathione peroxidase n=1 Tax=Corticibacter populi TaxID=1550736 RepID=A0A3M6QLZ6_9BURK|nr:glutathione peroxidase [Corticibacter populi]RMX03442.1 glutathione peroxidase [Corticibacter populi]RZS29877.1 glutathione peroxidase [Corticibacter populi]
MPPTTVFDFTVTAIDGTPLALRQYQGQVLLIVNTASACGFTPQLGGLEGLWRQYRERGLVVLGFPCNQFGGQDPGANGEIAQFCERNYGVDFPMMAKVDVQGSDASPLFAWLTAQAPGVLGTRRIKWNFTKFLVGRDGQVLRRFAPATRPERLAAAIERALG